MPTKDRADDLAEGVTSVFKRKRKTTEQRRISDFFERYADLMSDDIEGFLPPLRMLKGMVEKDPKEFSKGAALTVGGGVAGVALPKLLKAAIGKEKAITQALIEKFPSLGKNVEADLTVANSGPLPKFKLTEDAGNARKFAKSLKLIEESGGKNVRLNEKTGKVTWQDAKRNFHEADLTQRFGPRQLGTNPRARGENPRAEDLDSIESGDLDNLETIKADKDDIVSRVSEASGVSRKKMKELAEKGTSYSAKQKAIEKFDDELDEWAEDDIPSKSMRVNKPRMDSRNPDGSQKTMYHGTSVDKDFKKFRQNQRGTFFTDDKEAASNYSMDNDSKGYKWEGGRPIPKNERSRVMAAKLNVDKTYKLTDEELQSYRNAPNYADYQRKLAQRVRSEGYDSIDYPDSFVVLDPNKIEPTLINGKGDLPPMSGSMRASKPRMSSKIDEDTLPSFTGRHAADSGGTSTEEIARQGSFYKIGKNGEPTYLSKAVDAGNLGPDDAIIHVVPGREPVIYQGSGPKTALVRFKKTQTGSQFYKHELNAGPNIGRGSKRQTLTATQIPNIDASKYGKHVTDMVGNRKIKFASDFDKTAYALAQSKIPNRKILNDVMKLTKFDEDTILQHGFRIKSKIDQAVAAGGRKAITLQPRSIQVIGEPESESLRRQLWGLPSEFKFAGDLPALRQSFRPVVTHPIKTGLPAFKRAFGSMTERGYRQQIENFPDELAIYDVLDIAKAVGPTKAKQLYPNIKQVEKLGGTKHDVYDYFSSGTLGEQIPGAGHLPKVSKRMFDVFQRSVRGTETQRLADLLGKSVEDLAKTGDSELPSLIRSVNERSGHGPLGAFEPAANEMSYWFNAPRNTMAKAQFYNPMNYVPESVLPKFITEKGLGGRYGTKFSSPIYKDFMLDSAKLGGGLYGLKKLSESTGIGDVDLDPRSSMFGADYGNWHPDIFGGEKGIPQTAERMLTHTGVNAKGDEYDLDPKQEFLKFMRYRLKPGIPAMLGDLILGHNRDTNVTENAIGEDISAPFDEQSPIRSVMPDSVTDLPYSRWIANQFTTSWPSDVYDAYTGAGPVQGALSTVLGGAGMGSNTFDPNDPYQPYRAENKFIRIPKRENKGRKEILPDGLR